MDKYNKQQAFDSTVAMFAEGTILEGDISILTKVKHLETIVSGMQEAAQVLDKIRRYCKMNAIPDSFYVRTREYKPLVKNGTTRGETKELTPKIPNRRAWKKHPAPEQTVRTGAAAEVVKKLKQAKRALTINELSEKVGKEASTINYALNNLMKDKTVKRRKAKAEEKTSPCVKYVYEVAA